MERAVVLLSGGLDSATTLALAREQGCSCHALSVDYGQRHRAELDAAVHVARALGAVEQRTLRIDLGGIGGSALTDSSIAIPESPQIGIPVTYVPARNTVMLAFALGWAEVLGARRIFIGVNAVDYSGYPDCRPEYLHAFQALADLATRAGVEGRGPRIHAPLIDLSKSQIIRKGVDLGVDFGLTVSCYDPIPDGKSGSRPCHHCDACRLRTAGFKDAGLADPAASC